MYERSQDVDRHTEHMAEDADDDQCDGPLDSGSHHGTQQVDDAGDDAGGKSQCEESRIGQDIGDPAGDAVYSGKSSRDLAHDGRRMASCRQENDDHSSDEQELARGGQCR